MFLLTSIHLTVILMLFEVRRQKAYGNSPQLDRKVRFLFSQAHSRKSESRELPQIPRFPRESTAEIAEKAEKPARYRAFRQFRGMGTAESAEIPVSTASIRQRYRGLPRKLPVSTAGTGNYREFRHFRGTGTAEMAEKAESTASFRSSAATAVPFRAFRGPHPPIC